MHLTRLFSVVLTVGVAGTATAQFPRPPRPVNVGWRDTVTHTPGFVTVARGVRIHYLDFGGTGTPLVLLAGIGNNAHAYDDFARYFTDKFHVISISRRGFGESSHPDTGYDLVTLTHDIKTVMDSLHFTRVYLAGHSFAGQEMTHFVRAYPGRVIKMAYLDGAYDSIDADSASAALTGSPPSQWPVKDPLTSKDTLTAKAYVDYVHRTRGVNIPEGDIRIRMSYDGIVEEEAPPYRAIAEGTSERQDWPSLPVPALAVFAFTDSASQTEPWMRSQTQYTKIMQAAFDRAQPYYRFLVADFLRAPKSKAVVIHGGHHWVFVSHRDQVVKAVRDWLLSG
jgi:pimeloyl-ACP methyl ester carboxylesterase